MARYDLKDMEKNEYITFVGSKKTGYYQLKLPNKLPNKKIEARIFNSHIDIFYEINQQ